MVSNLFPTGFLLVKLLPGPQRSFNIFAGGGKNLKRKHNTSPGPSKGKILNQQHSLHKATTYLR
jgi:hypothetical protein